MIEAFFLLLASNAPQAATDPLASARAGKLQCASPNVEKKTCMYGSSGAALSIPTSTPLPIPGLASLPVVGTALFSQPPITYFAYVLAPVLAWWLARTHAFRLGRGRLRRTLRRARTFLALRSNRELQQRLIAESDALVAQSVSLEQALLREASVHS